VWMGVAPQPFLDRVQPALDRTLALAEHRLNAAAADAAAPGAQGYGFAAATATPGVAASAPAAAATPDPAASERSEH